MSQAKKCLVVGLQDTGKSSYMAAFWVIERAGTSGHLLTFNKRPDNTQYLDSIGNNWLEQEPVNRSPNIEKELEFSLKHKDSGSIIELAIPDFKGERYKLILQNEVPPEIEKWLNDSDRILFFLPPTGEKVFNEELGVTAAETEDEKKPGSYFSVDEIEPWIQNIELLKYIYEVKGDLKMAFCVSKWDVNMNKKVSVLRWIEQEHLFFYNFVKAHFSNVNYFGVSAQGLDYEKRGDLTEDTVSELTDQGKRAYISTGTDKDYDITKPLAWLLED